MNKKIEKNTSNETKKVEVKKLVLLKKEKNKKKFKLRSCLCLLNI